MLLPHSLSKPKAAPKSTAKKTPVQVAPKLPLTASLHSKDDSDDDDDDNEGSASFFSLGQKDTYETVFASSTQTGVAPSSAQVNTMHEPSLRGPWLGPAAQASDLLGPALNPVRANNRQNVVPSEPTVEPLPGTSGSDEQLFTAQRHPDFEQVSLSAVPTKARRVTKIPVLCFLESDGIRFVDFRHTFFQNFYPEVGELESFLQDEEVRSGEVILSPL